MNKIYLLVNGISKLEGGDYNIEFGIIGIISAISIVNLIIDLF